MNVSKISVLNVNNSGVSPFRGDTPDYNVKSDNSKVSQATKFLYGAGIVSAGLLALGLAGRAGVFSKSVKNAASKASQNAVETINDASERVVDVLAKKPIVKPLAVNADEVVMPINQVPRAERLVKNAPDMEIVKTNLDYSHYTNPRYPEQKLDFWRNSTTEIYKMSYEDQYDEFGYMLNFIKNLDPSEVNFSINFSYLKRDNRLRCVPQLVDFITENPQFETKLKPMLREGAKNIFEYKSFGENFAKIINDVIFPMPEKGKFNLTGLKAAMFTNTETKISQMPYEKQPEAFREYLDFIKTLSPEQVNDSIIFTLGKYNTDNNIKMAEHAIKFAKENPGFNDTIVSNLFAYEPDIWFTKELAAHNFKRTDNLAKRYDNHVDNLIKIRKMLVDSGLKCDEKTRMKNRQDWIDIGLATANQYRLGFQYSPRLPEFRLAAFEYDMKQGISRQEADFMIKSLKAQEQTTLDSTAEKTFGIKFDDMIKRINDAVV